jgi:hypothetical protein
MDGDQIDRELMRRMEMAMNCAQFEEVVHDLGRAGTQGFELKSAALAHAEACARCGQLLEEVTTLDFALDGIAVQDANDHASPRVEAALLAEFRRQHAPVARSQRNFGIAAFGIAAALLLAVGLPVGHWAMRTRDVASRIAKTGVTASSVSSSAQSTTPEDQTASADDSEYATNFVSLPYADDPGTLDGGTVVRVTLSRAALASFGLPVADLNAADPIPADIALSEDGVPQAIRLVADADLDQAN